MTDLRDRLRLALGAAYTLDRELGGGGMSRAFVATETALGRTVVVKVLPPELAAGVRTDRFTREIALAARLQHPHIVTEAPRPTTTSERTCRLHSPHSLCSASRRSPREARVRMKQYFDHYLMDKPAPRWMTDRTTAGWCRIHRRRAITTI
jgi:serine/threonine protein kinase